MLHEFLNQHREAILALTEKKSLELAGVRPSSAQLRQGLPIFYQQLTEIVKAGSSETTPVRIAAMASAASRCDEEAIATAGGRPDEAEVAKQAGLHGTELLRLGYTLSHVVHAYGAMCQSITELATEKKSKITANEFHDMNHCLGIAIAGAVTEFQSHQNHQDSSRELEHLGFLAHELRNALTSVSVAFQLIRQGTVGFGGRTGDVMKEGLDRIEHLIDRSLTDVRMRVDPTLHTTSGNLLRLVDQILATAEHQAESRNQHIEVEIDPALEVQGDQQLIHSAVSNLIQNALKYSKPGGRIRVCGRSDGKSLVIEVEDECGGLKTKHAQDLFKPFEQKNENREGLGLGLTIAQRAIALHRGKLDVSNLPGVGCIFTITLPTVAQLEAALPEAPQAS